MRKLVMCAGTLVAVAAAEARAQDPVCLWQGTLHPGPAYRAIVLDITKNKDGGWKVAAIMGPPGRDHGELTRSERPGPVVLNDATVALTFEDWSASYRGTMSGDGYRLDGTWQQNGNTERLVFYCGRRSPRNSAPDRWAHSTRFIRVSQDVHLEIVDWGGTGRPLILLHGGAATAHSLDAFGVKLASEYHVYGITRRGEGRSSVPDTGYSLDRLGDDVVAVMDTLGLRRAVLVGHSFGGFVLSDVASRYPERVAGAVYLDSDGAFVDSARENPYGFPLRDCPCSIPTQLNAGAKAFRRIPVPILAIFALKDDSAATAPLRFSGPLRDDFDEPIIRAREFERGLPTAHVVRLWPATHLVYESNESDVLREMRAFIARLPEPP